MKTLGNFRVGWLLLTVACWPLSALWAGTTHVWVGGQATASVNEGDDYLGFPLEGFITPISVTVGEAGDQSDEDVVIGGDAAIDPVTSTDGTGEVHEASAESESVDDPVHTVEAEVNVTSGQTTEASAGTFQAWLFQVDPEETAPVGLEFGVDVDLGWDLETTGSGTGAFEYGVYGRVLGLVSDPFEGMEEEEIEDYLNDLQAELQEYSAEDILAAAAEATADPEDHGLTSVDEVSRLWESDDLGPEGELTDTLALGGTFDPGSYGLILLATQANMIGAGGPDDAPATVPAPGALLLAGLGGLIAARRRRGASPTTPASETSILRSQGRGIFFWLGVGIARANRPSFLTQPVYLSQTIFPNPHYIHTITLGFKDLKTKDIRSRGFP